MSVEEIADSPGRYRVTITLAARVSYAAQNEYRIILRAEVREFANSSLVELPLPPVDIV